ncbi:SixA phosphatase family protein [Aequorivita echinoideorum]|uniref:Histidine phosphatase family protein n=1 Tax=Aequorivita echinoideorum TaxID=1549647 RepID=A0ABS5S5X7_9FLAO|nr:phosphoglycerate mutase family protein [Aequorivita echinoideorum]MBT0608618.1 histidine phosphatase family protein [Aequorivita echinoideorum]
MKNLLLLLLIFSISSNNSETKTSEINKSEESTQPETSTYYLMRHAEKVRTNAYDEDPNLSIEGLQRSKRWATHFETIPLDAVYATKYIRTKQTVSTIAQQKQITIQTYVPERLFSEKFLANTRGKNILIVGHSNTIPQLANQLIGEEKYENMDDSDNSTLFIVTINGNDRNVEILTVE